MQRRIWGVLMAGVAATAGCGGGNSLPVTDGLVVKGSAPPSPYAGPLRLKATAQRDDDPFGGAGAALQALECTGKPYLGGPGEGEWGEGDGGETAAQALQLFLRDDFGTLPESGYRVEHHDATRVLYSFDTGGRTRVAVIVAKDLPHRPGWGWETYAQCDPSELPKPVRDKLPIRIWEDRAGGPVPVTKVQSNLGPEHCDWQDVEFLSLGKRQYVRDAAGAIPRELLRSAYAGDVTMPSGATDTGYRQGDRALWLAADGTSAYVRTPDGIERWPGTTELVACR
ncbi:hypothetical protein [Streptomyces sp. NBC_01465]|uniref:hypothetical protein n=1 Tax=Streptomyces sp. NBC_01465 TaxID=2903878 RepID=UPI002E3228E9|nr:hypothetical protein [Streptomyces sp. NBC_01465]